MKRLATLAIEQKVRRASFSVIAVLVVIAAITVIFVPLWRGQILIGTLAGVLLLLLTIWTVRRAVRSNSLGAGWIALDYLLKIAILALAVVSVRLIFHEYVLVTAVILILCVIAATLIQTSIAFAGQLPSSND